jgi:hypothetical protein
MYGVGSRARANRSTRMSGHKFKVGATVDFRPGRMGFPAASRECTIVRVLPTDGSDLLYRIKCTAEVFERVVSEGQLAERQ